MKSRTTLCSFKFLSSQSPEASALLVPASAMDVSSPRCPATRVSGEAPSHIPVASLPKQKMNASGYSRHRRRNVFERENSLSITSCLAATALIRFPDLTSVTILSTSIRCCSRVVDPEKGAVIFIRLANESSPDISAFSPPVKERVLCRSWRKGATAKPFRIPSAMLQERNAIVSVPLPGSLYP